MVKMHHSDFSVVVEPLSGRRRVLLLKVMVASHASVPDACRSIMEETEGLTCTSSRRLRPKINRQAARTAFQDEEIHPIHPRLRARRLRLAGSTRRLRHPAHVHSGTR